MDDSYYTSTDPDVAYKYFETGLNAWLTHDAIQSGQMGAYYPIYPDPGASASIGVSATGVNKNTLLLIGACVIVYLLMKKG